MKHLLIILFIPVIFSCSNKNEVLLNERIELINGTIEYSNAIMIKENEDLFNKIGSNSNVKLDTIRQLSQASIEYFDNLKNELVDNSGGYNDWGRLTNYSNFSFTYDYIINSKHQALFKENLNQLPQLISSMEIFEAPLLFLEPKKDPYWSKFPNQNAKTGLQLFFENSNVPSVLATISTMQKLLLQYERKAYEIFLLDELASLRAR